MRPPPAWRGSRPTPSSAEFKQQYAQIRDVHKPPPPEFAGTPEDELKKADEEQKQQTEDSKKAIAALPAEQRAQVEEAHEGGAGDDRADEHARDAQDAP